MRFYPALFRLSFFLCVFCVFLTRASLFGLVISCVLFGSCLGVNTSAVDCLERLVTEMTYCVWSGTLNSTYYSLFMSGNHRKAGLSHWCCHSHHLPPINSCDLLEWCLPSASCNAISWNSSCMQFPLNAVHPVLSWSSLWLQLSGMVRRMCSFRHVFQILLLRAVSSLFFL